MIMMKSNGNLSWARKLATSAVGLAIIAAAAPALAVECIIDFPHVDELCQEGSSIAISQHDLRQIGGIFGFSLGINMLGGSIGASAYGIDENGNHLNTCRTTASDVEVGQGVEFASCEQLYGEGEGFAPNLRFYQHPVDMAATVVVVI